MTSYNMRPQDIVVLLKILTLPSRDWKNKDLAAALFLSPAEISNSLQRSIVSGLLESDGKTVKSQALLDFLVHGLPFVFPQIPTGTSRGLPTAHSHPFFNNKIISNEPYVWPDAESSSRGQIVQPLYPGAVPAAKKDEKLYLYLALVDVLRLGKVREKQIAIEKMKDELNEPSH